MKTGVSFGSGRVLVASWSLCGSGGMPSHKLWLAISALDSVAPQKYGGLATQPMGNTSGKATRGVPSGAGGKATPREGF